MRLKFSLIALVGLFFLLAGFRPEAVPYLRYDARYSDAVLAHWPNTLYLRESVLQQGAFPLWRETTMAGQPFAANPLNKTAYPLQWLALIFPPALHLNSLIVLHLLLAGVGMWRWTRALGLRTEAAALSVLAYALAPRVIGHMGAGHLDVFYALAWWPWLMWAIRQTTAKPDCRVLHVLQTAVFAALVFLADVRVSLFALIVAALYELAHLAAARQLRQIHIRLLLVPIFFGLTAAVLVPLRVWEPYLNRGNLTPAEAGILPLEWGNLLGLILPTHQGSVETLTYLGLPVLALAAIGAANQRRRTVLWITLIVVAALYALGANGPLWPLAVRIVPALLWFRVPSRAWLTLALLVPLLAGYGFQWLLEMLESLRGGIHVQPLRRIRLAIVAFMAMTLAAGAFALVALPVPKTMGAGTLLIGGALGILLLAALTGRISPSRLTVLMIGLTFLDLVWTDYQWIDWRGPEVWLDPFRPLAERLVEDHADRIYSPTFSLEQQVAESYHLKLFGGVDPFQLEGIVEAVAKGSGVPVTKYEPVLPPLGGAERDEDTAKANRSAVIDTRTLADWHVSHVVAAYAIDNPGLALLVVVNGVYIYRNRDYRPSPLPPAIPDWPPGAPDLPDAATVARLNQMTLLATWISVGAWLISLCSWIFLKLRVRPITA